MTTAQKTIRDTRKQLAMDGADPFMVAAVAIQRAQELEQRVAQLEALLKR
jgi:hypothetical protein